MYSSLVRGKTSPSTYSNVIGPKDSSLPLHTLPIVARTRRYKTTVTTPSCNEGKVRETANGIFCISFNRPSFVEKVGLKYLFARLSRRYVSLCLRSSKSAGESCKFSIRKLNNNKILSCQIHLSVRKLKIQMRNFR